MVEKSTHHFLTVFAYNDSVVVFNGKPLVSAHGGTWYRSKWMMKELRAFHFSAIAADSVMQYAANKGRIHFFLIDNPGGGKIFTPCR